MRKGDLFSVLLSLFLLASASITRAQTISSQKGLTTAVFTTTNGTIKVYLPDDIRQGDRISGRVVAQPDGRNEKQLERNLAELASYQLRLNGEKFFIDKIPKTIGYTVPQGQQVPGTIELLKANGTSSVQQLTIHAKSISEQAPVSTSCIIPGHVLAGSPMTVPGPFDGNAGNTQCTIGGQTATILAESPRSCIVAFPATATGMQATQVKENGQESCNKLVSGVEMNVTTGKLNLQKGERTYIDVMITGLQQLNAPAILLLNNMTTEVVVMQPSNTITIPLAPDSVQSGTFNRRFDVQSIRTGNFAVNVNLDFQDIMLTPKPGDPVPGNGNNPPAAGNGVKSDPPKVEIEKDDPKNPITWDSIPPPGKACNPTLSHTAGSKIVGGLRNSFIGTDNGIYMQRDDFIVLEAYGADTDLAVKTCSKIPDCLEDGCSIEVPIEGKVRFEWKAIEDPKGKKGMKGSFVQIGCIPDEATAKGEQVIFKPPYVPLASVGTVDTTIFSTIILSVIDDGSPVPDATLNKTITIAISRSKASPDRYTVVITGGKYIPEVKPAAAKDPPGCPCKPIGPLWTTGDNLTIPEIVLPSVGNDKNKLVLGQKVLISTRDQIDMDIATYGCTTTCPTTTIKKSYHDIVIWKWKIEEVKETDMGRILLSDSSQYIVYEAPKAFPVGTDFLDIKIMVEVHNPPGRDDAPKTLSAEKVFRVYRPGVRVNYTPLSWLPGENKILELKSELMYKSEKGWLPGLNHMCRIQYFELFKISQEKGVCMNASSPGKNENCFDLQLKKQKGVEMDGLQATEAGKCEIKDQYMKANTESPVREFTMNIFSLDYGAYGFFRSFANKNKGMTQCGLGNYKDDGREKEPVFYESVPWRKTEVLHPQSASGRGMLKEYDDNRVTIPHDVDENHIADNGWKSIRGTKLTDVPDPLLNNTDEDDLPVGNKTKGDGLTTYEEYRGFKVLLGREVIFTRANHLQKDIFIFNVNKLDIHLFGEVTDLDVHQVNEENILPDSRGTISRSINFNFNPHSPTHIVDQKGLRLVDKKYHKGLLGIACPDNDCIYPGTVAPPNWIYEIWVYTGAIREKAKAKGYDPELKLAQVVAHELCHGINICHHGEGDLNKEDDFQKINGLRSGDIDCIMRYDNSGTPVMGKKGKNDIPELIGNKLCTSAAGTGYNVTSNNPGFGDADAGRGNCLSQIQVTGFGNKPEACKK